jgi:5-methylcytosine-specific restriction enzyme subunit McrC
MNVSAWSETVVDLTAEQAQAVARSGLAEVRIDTPPTQWKLVTGSRVGVIVGLDWELRVEPRLDIPQLLFLLAYAFTQDGWRDVVAGFSADDELLDAVGAGFATHAARAIERGLVRGYVNVDERRLDLRGRVRFADQIARVPGLPLPIEVSYDDFTADVHENRLLLTAAEVLLRLPRVPARARQRLLWLRAQMEEVTTLRDPRTFDVPGITRLNAHYEPALVLAALILHGASVTAHGGEVSSASFVFDMNRVFEDFVSLALRDSLRRYGGEVRFQHRDRLDEADRAALPIKPDITWWGSGECLAVIDAKYKSIAERAMPNADAYQMLAYCTALRRRNGFVIYAQDSGEQPRRHTIRNTGHVIDVQVLDVGRQPERLLADVDVLADEIASSVGARAKAA